MYIPNPKRSSVVFTRSPMVARWSPSILHSFIQSYVVARSSYDGCSLAYDGRTMVVQQSATCIRLRLQNATIIEDQSWRDRRGLRLSLQGLRWLHDGRRQSYIVLFSLMLSHDHRTMVAAYRTMVVRWSCNNRRLAYDLDSKMLRSLKTSRKAIVVCDCSYDCGQNHCDCPRSLPVVGSRRS